MAIDFVIEIGLYSLIINVYQRWALTTSRLKHGRRKSKNSQKTLIATQLAQSDF